MSIQHHAYLFIGERVSCTRNACTVLSIEERLLKESPDVHLFQYTQLGIDDVHILKRTASGRPVQESLRTFILTPERITGEAQNALLKLFEDPPSTARFVLIMPRADALIPTLLSRLYTIETDAVATDTTIAEQFLAQSYAERLADVVTYTKAKDITWVHALLSGLERLFSTRDMSASREAVRDILLVRQYIDTRGASPKILLEHLAVSLPR